MSRFVVFPAGCEAQADAYLAFCNANNPDPTPGAVWDLPDRVDRNGQRVVGLLGPGGNFNGGDVVEPQGGLEARIGGETVEKVTWPDFAGEG